MATALADAGIIVIDNSSTFRLDPDCPLVVPEVNPHAIRPEHRIFPVGNCTAIVLCVALAPIERAVGLRSVRVATYQAVSGAGRAGLETLADEEARRSAQRNVRRADLAQRRAAGRLVRAASANNGEEDKVVAETRKMLNRPDLHVAATLRARARCAARTAKRYSSRPNEPTIARRARRRLAPPRRASCSTTAASSRRSTSRTPTSSTSRACVPKPRAMGNAS